MEINICQIGHPCNNCIETCSFRITYSHVNDQDEKEKKDERTTKEFKRESK